MSEMKKEVKSEAVGSGRIMVSQDKPAFKLRVWGRLKHSVLLDVIVAIVVIGLMTGGYFLFRHGVPGISHPGATNQQLSLTNLSKQVSQDIQQKKFTAAINLIQSQVKYQPAQVIAALNNEVNESSGNYSVAIAQDQVLVKKNGMSESLAVNIAALYAAEGNNKEAINYYQQAISILQKQTQTALTTNSISQIQQLISRLQNIKK